MAKLPMGTAILRRYVLIGAIGQGGVSTVYSAVDARQGRKLAVKVLAPSLADDAQAREDVRREALITDRLRHPSVPRVFEYGEAPLPDGSVVPYVVLELLAGVPLTERLARGRLEWPEAVRIAATAADVLAVAHRRGVVHRDLSARNIMVSPAGIKIIDFGLATAALRSGDSGAHPVVIRRGPTRGYVTRDAPLHGGPLHGGSRHDGSLHSSLLHGGSRHDGSLHSSLLHGGSRHDGPLHGGPRHDSPRHEGPPRNRLRRDGPPHNGLWRDGPELDGRRHDGQDHDGVDRDAAALPSHPKTAFARPADDVYTLGVLLYEMLTGRSPYPPAVAAMIVAAGRAGHLAPTPVLTIPGLPLPLRDLVRACMTKRPEDRPPSVDVALGLWRMLDGAHLPEPSVN